MTLHEASEALGGVSVRTLLARCRARGIGRLVGGVTLVLPEDLPHLSLARKVGRPRVG